MEKITFKSAWENCEKTMPLPTRARKTIIVNFEEFKKKILEEKKEFVKKITKSLFNGDFYILKEAFTKEFMLSIKKKHYFV